MNDFLNGDRDQIPTKIEIPAAKYQKYCTVTSVDIERAFSAFKLVLDDQRQNLLKIQNAQMCIAINITLNDKEIYDNVHI